MVACIDPVPFAFLQSFSTIVWCPSCSTHFLCLLLLYFGLHLFYIFAPLPPSSSCRQNSKGEVVFLPHVSPLIRQGQARFLLESVPPRLRERFLLRGNSNGATAITQAAHHGNLTVLQIWLNDPCVSLKLLLHHSGEWGHAEFQHSHT